MCLIKTITMNRIFLSLTMSLSCFLTFAQTKSGIATYTVPSGWNSSIQGSYVLLENATKRGDTCQIRLLNTEAVAITTKESFARTRTTKSGKGIAFSKDPSSINLSEINGIVCLSSQSIANPAKPDQRYYIYSFSNKQESYFVLLYTNNINSCKDAMNNFLKSLLTDELASEEPITKGSNVKRRRKAAPAAAPAAPAPMM